MPGKGNMTMTKLVKATVLAAAALALSACKHNGATTGAGSGVATGPRTTSPVIAELLAGVPGSATALSFIDIDRAPWAMLTGGWPFPLDEASRQTLDKDLREHVDRYLGVDLSRLQYAVGFVAGPPARGAVLLKAVTGTPKIPGAGDHEGGKLWLIDPDQRATLAIRRDVVVFGEDSAVREVLETLAGKRKPVTTENPVLVDWLRKQSAGAAFAFAAVRPRGMPLPSPADGLERIAATIDARRIAAVVEGTDASISALQAMSDQAFAAMQAEVDKARSEALAAKSPPAEGAGAIIAAAYIRSYAARLKPRRTGNQLSISIDLEATDIGSAMFVPLIGIVSAVAIPAYMDYMKRSKKTEASLQLNKIARNAKRTYAETGVYPPGSAPLTPPRPCCGQPENHCPAAPALYASNPVWKAIDFQIDEPSLFQYSYSASADGQRFVARAVGDLDCDGATITYELTGTVSQGVAMATLTEPPLDAD
jgi:hypothetical protein